MKKNNKDYILVCYREIVFNSIKIYANVKHFTFKYDIYRRAIQTTKIENIYFDFFLVKNKIVELFLLSR